MQSSYFSTACASCRLRYQIILQQRFRSRKSIDHSKALHSSSPLLLRQRHRSDRERGELHTTGDSDPRRARRESFLRSQDETVRKARQQYGDSLPDGLLNVEQGKHYERLYGRPLKSVQELEQHTSNDHATRLERPSSGGWREVSRSGAGWNNRFDRSDARRGDIGSNKTADAQLLDDIDAAAKLETVPGEEDEDEERDRSYDRVHPLTRANRFNTNPRTVFLDKDALVEPLDAILKRTSSRNLTDAAHRTFGGIGLPDSTSTPALAKTMQQKPVALNVSHGRMSEMEADVFTAVLMPALYASITSVLVETRKRLGTAWAESMVRKAEDGTLQILDAGGAGMGVLAVRDMLRAEWERMKEDEQQNGKPLSVALAGGKTGGVSVSAPLGKATAWIASDALRQRASTVLPNTTFIPRMPDYVHTETARYSGKFDIIIAAHTIWPVREDWERRLHVENLWSLLRADSGVLCMLEKGVARGFEAIAAARRFLLRSRIAEPDGQHTSDSDQDGEWAAVGKYKKEPGMIIAPCTNHQDCPMYHGDSMGTIKGRKSICHFDQRYTRPAFLQRILHARDKNYEDVKFSYLSVMRGTDFRSNGEQPLRTTAPAVQGTEATDRAVEGFGEWVESEGSLPPSSLSLPRAFLPPLKRQGHVIIDLCTPSGTLERWTVPRSFSKQAFRDARKSSWGDLWAMGAKTRVPREAKLGKHARKVQQPKLELSKKAAKAKRRLKETKVHRAKAFDLDD